MALRVRPELSSGISGSPHEFDPADFGAVGDGVIDDTAAIQEVLDVAKAAGGGVVFLPIGTYLIDTSTLVIAGDNVTLQGDGWGSILKLGTNASLTANAFISIEASNIVIKDLLLDGSSRGTNVDRGIRINGTRSNIRVHNCYIKDFDYSGVACETATNIVTDLHVTDSIFENIRFGVLINKTASKYIWIDRCRALVGSGSASRTGFQMDRDASNIFISRCWTNSLGFGVAIASCTDVLISECICTGTTDVTRGQGIHVETTVSQITCEGVVIRDCICHGNIKIGIAVLGASDGSVTSGVKIIGCTAYSNQSTGISMSDVEHGIISDCIAYLNGQHGISVSTTFGTTRYVVAKANIVYNNNQAVAGGTTGLKIGPNAEEVIVDDLISYDDQATATQESAIRMTDSGQGVTIKNVRSGGGHTKGTFDFTAAKAANDEWMGAKRVAGWTIETAQNSFRSDPDLDRALRATQFVGLPEVIALTPTDASHDINTISLAGVSGGTLGHEIMIYVTTNTIVLKDGVDNISCGGDITITGDSTATLFYDGTNWVLKSSAIN